ncbi:MAG: fused MFS/spermidine synthase [Methylococcaceae bacterium]|nr:fused MFS/spermidine synthase [Methylococcaceae bacterium]
MNKPQKSKVRTVKRKNQERLLLVLLFFSGCAALLYEVLWMNDLGLLFGNTAQAAATTLTAFFSGIALGSRFWAEKVTQIKRPLRVFAYLEWLIALSVLGFWGIFSLYQYLYPGLELAEASQAFRLMVKFILAWLILLPPAFCMGGTLPVLSQYVVQNTGTLGQQVAGLYSANTLGGVLGVLLAGFLLPPSLGYQGCYLLAMLVNIVVGIMAWYVDSSNDKSQIASACPTPKSQNNKHKQRDFSAYPVATLGGLTFLSGVLTLALQVLWVRMFAQVLQNSVQTFAMILLVFLFTLGFSSALVNRLLAHSRWQAESLLYAVISTAALMLPLSTFLFIWLSSGLEYFGGTAGWLMYQAKVIGLLLLVMLPPLLLLGCVLPLLIKLAEHRSTAPGNLVGKILSLNTLGAIIGSFAAGFILLGLLGLWHSLLSICILLCCIALYLQRYHAKSRGSKRWIGLSFAVLATAILGLAPLPQMHAWPDNQELLSYTEGSAASVAVLGDGEARSLVVNNHYILGGTAMNHFDRLQGILPVLLHPNPKTVFTLGMGTGVTASSTLQFDIKQLLVSELLPEVVTAAQKYFSKDNEGLFSDPRARVIGEDGRNYLAASKSRYDIIIGDLFVPWSAGAGALYSREHFATVQQRLNDGGLFMQWLPSYQLSEYEFGVIVRTLLDVFPCVSLWRGDYVAELSSIGLLAEQQCQSLRPELGEIWLAKPELGGDRVPLFAHYMGELSAQRESFAKYPLNTDNDPIIEFIAPELQRQRMAKQLDSLNGKPLLNLAEKLHENAINRNNLLFAQQNAHWQDKVKMGLLLQQFASAVAEQNNALAARLIARYQTLSEQL